MGEESFGRRLRRERERRQIALTSIADNTKISVGLFEDLERDDASRWPSGIFRRAFIRSYAQAIGLDADAISREFLERFPDPNGPSASASPEHVTAHAAPHAALHTPLRLTLAAPESRWFAPGQLLHSIRERGAAVACDLAIVGVIGLAMYAVLGSFWMPLTIAIAGYYTAGVLLLGNTPGVCLFAPGGRHQGPSLPSLRTTGRAAFEFLQHHVPHDLISGLRLRYKADASAAELVRWIRLRRRASDT